MIKLSMLLACLLALAGCAANTAGVETARPADGLPKVQAPQESPKAEPAKADIAAPPKTADTVGQPEIRIPGVLTFKKNVTFNHASHSGSFACSKCHTEKPGKIANFGKDFAHESCKGCHKASGRDTSCSSCHRG